MPNSPDDEYVQHAHHPIEPTWRRALAVLATLLAAPLALAALASFAARCSWLFELASYFQSQYLWGLLACVALLTVARRWKLALAVGVFCVLPAGRLVPLYLPAGTLPSTVASQLRVLSLNVHARNRDYGRVLSFVRETAPDVAVFVEVTEPWSKALDALADDWPFAYTRADSGVFGVAIYSKRPLIEPRIELLSPRCPAVVAGVQIERERVTIFGVHPARPIFGLGAEHRDAQLAVLAELVVAEAGPKIVVGDLNVTSWSPGFTDFVAATSLRDSRRGWGVQPTWPTLLPSPLRIPIDHCLVSPDLHVVDRQAGPNVGSDHLPVIVDLTAL